MGDFLDWMLFRTVFGHNRHNDYSHHDYGRHDYGHTHDFGHNPYSHHSHHHHGMHSHYHHSGHNLANDMMDYWMFKNIFGDDD
ncbi:MAG: hypothetical protein IIX81_05575 [Tidjanibacter sp.]|nr:hypothetical protein [Tidjanibacter sp.]